MSKFAKIVLMSMLIVTGLACGLISSPISQVQNFASTAEALATAIPSGVPNIPDVTGYLNPSGTPVSSWNSIPVMPQATAGQEFDKNTYSYKIGSTAPSDVQAFYEDKLKSLGWSSQFGALAGTSGGFMVFTKDSSVLTITMAKSDQDNVVLLIMQ